MAFSALAITSPKTLFTIHRPVFPSKPTSSLSPFSCFSCLSTHKDANISSNSVSTIKKRIFDVGIGILAASILSFAPMDANATRIEYYATVGDPLCDFTFVRSGLGYCDLSVGTGEEAPYAELINVHYTARFADGIVFDSSYKRGRPLTMRIGVGKVLRGLDQGIFGGEGVPPMQAWSRCQNFFFRWKT
ncbi:photosynthetic NDH subunit of lumenal location 4, chloroplastic isoform X2 [Ricinus communis]|uniref:photosynthetic NDH subunit of lumenal location 4, chloroplastic isoform X2 n=1 Tax=Ricinus communis TaxID=3988 RepID=UPI000D692E3C|nr:photosynthetic NDH subunit of lumenal location 4, chloroplastic isoform X2 [Ricinus communis]|eukprot:XP_025014861.1 photosynthetic NDH subunit of lumenal location 4, chloroplastic isoform X2 [Ricinus communis]